jgi:3-isopropylmalate/(R)-2-methylmalate dehydratase small subunit
MQPFRTVTGIVAPLRVANVDTDQMVPKQFLKRVERTGFGAVLFYDWRFRPDGTQNPAFILNRRPYSQASILVAGRNFGCGSSREHAVWALDDFGIRAVLAPSFADIFAANCLKNGLLTVPLPDPAIELMMDRAEQIPGYQLTVSLETCRVEDGHSLRESFAVEDFTRKSLLEGLDEIALTLQMEEHIAAYESRMPHGGATGRE